MPASHPVQPRRANLVSKFKAAAGSGRSPAPPPPVPAVLKPAAPSPPRPASCFCGITNLAWRREQGMSAAHSAKMAENEDRRPITVFGPDFPFPYDDWLEHRRGLGRLPGERLGSEVAIIGAGMAGMVAAYELMKLGLKPVINEAGRIGGRLRSQAFEGATGLIAELGGMRFPVSGTGFYH